MSIDLTIFWMVTVLVILAGLVRMFYVHGHKTLIFSIFMSIVMPLSFTPFAFDARNIYAIGENYGGILRALERASFLYAMFSIVFFIAFYAAAEFWRPSRIPKVGFVSRGALIAIESDAVIAVLLLIQLMLVVVMVAGGVRFGGGLVDALTNVWIRPVANIWSVWSVFVGSLTSARFFLNPRLRTGCEVLLALLLSVVTGQRAVALLPLVTGLIAALGASRSRGVVMALIIGTCLIPAAVLLTELRASRAAETAKAQTSSVSLSGTESIAYGNNFSEVRDFAWVLGNFNGRPLGGLTYLAGYTSFVPSAILDFRTEWSFGVFTARTAGLDPRYTGGLRTGFFSEMYFNFGLIFALVGSVLYGLLTGRLFSRQLTISELSNSKAKRAASDLAAYYAFVVLNAIIFTPGFFFVLIMAALYLVIFSVRKMLAPRMLALPR